MDKIGMADGYSVTLRADVLFSDIDKYREEAGLGMLQDRLQRLLGDGFVNLDEVSDSSGLHELIAKALARWLAGEGDDEKGSHGGYRIYFAETCEYTGPRLLAGKTEDLWIEEGSKVMAEINIGTATITKVEHETGIYLDVEPFEVPAKYVRPVQAFSVTAQYGSGESRGEEDGPTLADAQRYWYVSPITVNCVDSDCDLTFKLSYGQIVRGVEVPGDTVAASRLRVVSVGGMNVYGDVLLPLGRFEKMDGTHAYLQGWEMKGE